MNKTLTILKIETKLLFRNPFALFFNIAFPTLMVLMYGSIYGNEPTPFYDGMGTIDASISGYVGMVIAVAAILTFPLTLAEYKEHRVYKRFDATPVQKEKIIFIQFFASSVLIIVGLAVLLVVAFLGYSVKIEGNPIMIVFSILLSIISLFGFGFFLTSISNNQKMSNLLCFASYFIMIFLSGASMPIQMFPDSIKFISKFLTLTYVINMLKNAFIGSELTTYYGDVIIVFIFGIACIFLGLVFYKRKNWG